MLYIKRLSLNIRNYNYKIRAYMFILQIYYQIQNCFPVEFYMDFKTQRCPLEILCRFQNVIFVEKCSQRKPLFKISIEIFSPENPRWQHFSGIILYGKTTQRFFRKNHIYREVKKELHKKFCIEISSNFRESYRNVQVKNF